MNVSRLRQLQTALSQIDPLIRMAVSRAQAAGQDPTDALRGLIISHEEADLYASQPAFSGFWPDDDTLDVPVDTLLEKVPDGPFSRLVRVFGLTGLDGYILLLCLAPELDRRYERLYAYLQDDVSQRRPTVNLMMNILGGTAEQRFAVWERLQPHQPLQMYQLMVCTPEAGRSNPAFLAYQLRVDHRITAYLLGDQSPDERLRDGVSIASVDPAFPLDETVLSPIRAVLQEAPLILMRGREGMGQPEMAAALCASHRLPLLSLDVGRLQNLDMNFDQAWRLAVREGYLLNAALFFEGWHDCLNEDHQPDSELWDALMRYPGPVFLSSERDWEPQDIERWRRLLRIDFKIPDYEERLSAWEHFTSSIDVPVDGVPIEELASKFRFTRTQIALAVNTAADLAVSRGDSVRVGDLYQGAQAHASLRLGHLAKKIVPRFKWDDLILPPDQLSQLKEITARARYAHIVQQDWGFAQKIAHLAGVSALFAGESGTGKTLSAEVIANDLGLVLYKIDLSAVVSKYIGETEKNLNTIFSEARSSNAILFFDEADALFGKRSEVKDARDRYANIEIAYLLQQIEDYDGIAVLATNLRQNLDEAFTRRLDFLVDFPFPDSEYRHLIWQVHFPSQAPLSSDVNLEEMAERYNLTGGNIRNVTVASAYLAAADGGVITSEHIRSAIRREHQKMGRLLDDY